VISYYILAITISSKIGKIMLLEFINKNKLQNNVIWKIMQLGLYYMLIIYYHYHLFFALFMMRCSNLPTITWQYYIAAGRKLNAYTWSDKIGECYSNNLARSNYNLIAIAHNFSNLPSQMSILVLVWSQESRIRSMQVSGSKHLWNTT